MPQQTTGYFKLDGETFQVRDGEVVWATDHGFRDAARDAGSAGRHFRFGRKTTGIVTEPILIVTAAFVATAIAVGPFAKAA